MKKLVLVTQAASTGPTYVQWLRDFFGSGITLERYSVENNDFSAMSREADLYLVAATSTDAFSQVMAAIPAGRKVVSVGDHLLQEGDRGPAGSSEGHPGPCW